MCLLCIHCPCRLLPFCVVVACACVVASGVVVACVCVVASGVVVSCVCVVASGVVTIGISSVFVFWQTVQV